MRGGLERWKRGVGSRGVGQAIDYALKGTCDAHLHPTTGSDALEMYSAAADASVTRFVVADGTIVADELTSGALRMWVTGHDPVTGEERGVQRLTADADLLLDATVNHPKSYSIAALLHPELAVEFEALQDRLRDRILLTWLRELNARRGHGGLIREDLVRIEVLELQHRRSRALDPHAHRHLPLRFTPTDARTRTGFRTVSNGLGRCAGRAIRGIVIANVSVRSARVGGGTRSDVAIFDYCGVTFRRTVNGRDHGRIDQRQEVP